GSYGRVDGKVIVNVPLSDEFYAKASLASFNQKGFLDAPTQSGKLGDTNKDAGRIALRWAPDNGFEANLNADYTAQRENGVPHILTHVFEGTSFERLGAASVAMPAPQAVPGLGFTDFFNVLATTPVGEQGCFDQNFPVPPHPNPRAPCPDGTIVVNPEFGKDQFNNANAAQDINSDDRANYSELDLSSNSDIWGIGLTLEYQFTDDLGVKSITSYRDTEARTGYDADGQPISQNALIDIFDVDQFSQELQLLGEAFDGRLKYVIGGYHFEEAGINLDDVEFTPVRILSGARIDNRSSAAFFQFTYDATEQLSVTAGLRYTDEKKKFITDDTCHELPKGPETLFDGTVVTCAKLQTVIDPKYLNTGLLATLNGPNPAMMIPGTPLVDIRNFIPGAMSPDDPNFYPGNAFDPAVQINPYGAPAGNARLCCLPISNPSGDVSGLLTGLTSGYEVLPRGTTTRNFDDWTPHASIAYRWNDDLMTYFSYSQGFKSGGFVQRVFPPSTAVASFDPETATVFEIGFKWTGLDSRLRVNAAGFHTEYDDLQVQVNNGIAPITQNAAAAEINGAELEITLLPAPGWMLNGSVGWLDASYTELDPNSRFDADLHSLTVDSDLVNAPKWSTSMGVQYAHQFTNGGELVSRFDWSYKTETTKDALNFPRLYQKAFHLLNLGVSYVSRDGDWVVSAFGKNITNEKYFVSGWAAGYDQQIVSVNLGRPAEWGISFKYLFGN
ncbi:MAG: TonB-dependent receptor, partial [Gammaproteobacteria bacterium]